MVAKNPLSILALKASKSPKPVTLRHTNQTYQITYAQFRVFRDMYPMLKEYSIEQIENDTFKLGHNQSEVCSTSEYAPLMFELMQDFTITREKDIFWLKNEELEICGSLQMLMCLHELREGEYNNNYNDKVVLDVGGFEGESAAYFWSKGAKKIIIYEPIAAHIDLIRKNVKLNDINAEIHVAGIAEKSGKQTINYEMLDPGVGTLSRGSRLLEIEVVDVSQVIEQSGADIAKFDCEGAEESLIGIPAEILQKIPDYIIEVHSFKIRSAVLEKFQSAGFTLEKEIPKPGEFSVLVFKRDSVSKT